MKKIVRPGANLIALEAISRYKEVKAQRLNDCEYKSCQRVNNVRSPVAHRRSNQRVRGNRCVLSLKQPSPLPATLCPSFFSTLASYSAHTFFTIFNDHTMDFAHYGADASSEQEMMSTKKRVCALMLD